MCSGLGTHLVCCFGQKRLGFYVVFVSYSMKWQAVMKSVSISTIRRSKGLRFNRAIKTHVAGSVRRVYMIKPLFLC